MDVFNHLDWDNLNNILKWLCEIQEISDHPGVGIEKGRVISIFLSYGFLVNDALGDDFDGEDKEIFARYIIGQALSTLSYCSIHPVVKTFYKSWHDKFMV